MYSVYEYIDKIKEYYASSIYVHSIYLAWSYNEDKQNLWSDIDLWIVCYEESHLKIFVEMIVHDMKLIYDILWRYRPIYYHYFFILSDYKQLDINIVSHAQFCSMQKSLKMISKNHIESSDVSGIWNNKISLQQLIQMIYAEIERTIPKIIKWEYVVAVRFITGIRENLLMQLMALTGIIKYNNKADINIQHTSTGVVECFYDTFCRPEKNSISIGVKAILNILEIICEENNLNEYDIQKEKIQKILSL